MFKSVPWVTHSTYYMQTWGVIVSLSCDLSDLASVNALRLVTKLLVFRYSILQVSTDWENQAIRFHVLCIFQAWEYDSNVFIEPHTKQSDNCILYCSQALVDVSLSFLLPVLMLLYLVSLMAHWFYVYIFQSIII